MTLEELKSNIESKTDINSLVIFKISDIDFIPLQYIDAIRVNSNKDIEYLESLDPLYDNSINIFGDDDTDNIKLAVVNEFDSTVSSLKNKNNTFIITKKITPEARELFNDYIIEIPKLEGWQIKDFVYSMAEGVPTKSLDKLIEICKNDIFRLDKEVKKLSIFDKDTRKDIFGQFVKDDIFNDLSSHNIFDMSNAIMKRDYKTLVSLYREIDNIDCEPLGLLTTLYNNFKNVILIQLSNNPTAESCGMTAKQFWAVKYSCGHYSKDQLLKIFNFLTDIDRKIKNGELPVELLVDYLITYIMSI